MFAGTIVDLSSGNDDLLLFFAFLWHTINTLSILTWLVAIIYETLYY